MRYYLALHQENLIDLQRAAALDSYDSSLQTHLGWKELKEGRAEQAAVAWQQALRANPTNAAAITSKRKIMTSANNSFHHHSIGCSCRW